MIEITEYRTKLNENLQQFVQLVSTVTPEGLLFKQGSEWNLLEILEHIVITERLVMSTIGEESGNFSDELELFGFEKLKKLMIDYRHKKVKAPGGLEPTNSGISAQDLLLQLQAGRNELVEDIQSAKLWMSAEVYKHPMLGEMTVIDWLHFILLHSQRHYLQMQEQLKAYQSSIEGR